MSLLLLLAGACANHSTPVDSDISSDTTIAVATSDPVTSTGIPTTTGDSSATSTTSSTTSSSGSSTADTDMATTEPGGPSRCGPPCDVTWTHIGSIELYAPEVDNADAYACVTRVIGDVSVSGFSQNELGGLRNLVSIEGSLYVGGEKITDLSAFECLEEASTGLQIAYANNLIDPSGMSRLRSTGGFRMKGTGATVMPTFAPGFTVDGNIEVKDNPALKNLDAVADWKSAGATGVYIINNASLTSIEGIQSVLISAQVTDVQLHNLPALSSIAGLDGVSEFLQLSLSSLPLVVDLMPLAQVEHVNGLLLNDMPKLTDMQGLNQLETVDYLQIGGCWSSPLIGNMNLQSLEGLSSLTTVGRLGIGWNPNLGMLAGADKLTTVEVRWNAEFNALDEADLAAFAAQVGMERCDFNFDRECSCFN